MTSDENIQTIMGLNAGNCQSDVIAFLSNPESYPGFVTEVQRIETHCAIVFLAGSQAYKLKRAICLPYLDFSTRAKRALACQNELKRNRSHAPGIYIGSLAVTRERNGALAIDGDGEIVDWLVVMNRFEQAQLFDTLVKQRGLDLELMEPLAECIGKYHAHAERHSDVNGEESVAQVITQIVSATHAAADKVGLDCAQDLSRKMVAAFNLHAHILKLRSMSGYVRLCHGDLHLGNIVLHDGKPTLFDALEFNDTLATIDVLYDLAFLLMDFWHRGLNVHANRCLNAYASQSMSTAAMDGLAVLPLFMAMRAAIRGMVAVDKASVASYVECDRSFEEAREYFRRAADLLTTSDPVLIAVGGLSGTGKTTLAASLAPCLGTAPGAVHLRSDIERKRMFGADPLEQLPAHAYSSNATYKVYRRLCDRASHALEAGHSVVVDAVFLEATYRRWIEQVAGRAECNFLGLWLEAGDDQLVERVTKRIKDASDADADVVRSQLAVRGEAGCWARTDARGLPEEVLRQADRAIMMQPGAFSYSRII